MNEKYLVDPSEYEYRSDEEIRNCYNVRVAELSDVESYGVFSYDKDSLIGKILLEDVGSNTIPSEILDELEYNLGWNRLYWG